MPRYIKVASVHDVPPGEVVSVMAGRDLVALCNVDGRIYAIQDVCTHDGSSFGMGFLDGNTLTCPRHGAQFDVTTGEVVSPPAYEPVPVFEARVSGDDIEVATE
jgi:nitrite reductase/ring-hydroxylating ferredoxin subunit